MNGKVSVLLAMVCLASVLLAGGMAEDCVSLIEGMVFDASYSGKTVAVCAGDYAASGDGDFLTVEASDFTLDCGGAKITGIGNGTGISAQSTEGVTLENCKLAGFDKAVVVDDAVSVVFMGLSVADSNVGLYCRDVVRGKVQESEFKSSGVGAVLISGYVVDVENSVFDGNDVGLQVDSTEGSVFRDNSFLNNSVGFKAKEASAKVYKNVFKSEKNAVADNSTVEWDFAKEGNFWGDYDASLDSDSDGIGDKPYVVLSSAGANAGQDSFPFVKEDFSTAVSHELTEREGTYENLRRGNKISFGCGKNDSYELVLLEAAEKSFSVGEESFVLEVKKEVDLDRDGVVDIGLFLLRDNIESLDVKLVRLGGCVSYCGDGVCLLPETKESCEDDCVEKDGDKDGVMVSEGDCDDSDADVYPGAEEICIASVDADCDGLYGDEDPDCQSALGFGFWFFLLVFLGAGGAAAYLLIKSKKGGGARAERVEVEEFEDERSASEPKKAKTVKKTLGLGKLKGYAKQYLDQGMDLGSVKQTLLAQGWPSDKINAALKELEGEI